MARRLSTKRFRVGIIHGTELACFREVIRGINAFAALKGTWHIDLVSPIDDFISYVHEYQPDGLLLGQLSSHDERVKVTDMVGNCVSAIGQHSPTNVRRIPEVEANDEAIGSMAAQYFVQKGFRNLAFMGAEANWSRERWAGFKRTAQEFGCEPRLLQHAEGPSPTGRGFVRPHYGDEIVAWLRSLPKPVGVLACNDIRGRELNELCLEEDLKVPDQLAIMGVDNDDLECELSHPPLSSVAVPWREAGFRAASLLSDLFDGKDVPAVRHLIDPTMVCERQSTDTLAIHDEEVAAAVRFIRENAHQRISVEDVLREVPAARRSLEKRFRAILGRSPLEEIRRVHIERAKHLLLTTDLAMPEIAEASGFTSAAWFSKAFHDIAGEAPISYRRRLRQPHKLIDGESPSSE